MAKAVKLKEPVEVDFGGKKITLQPGVSYKNLSKEVLDQIPRGARVGKAKE